MTIAAPTPCFKIEFKRSNFSGFGSVKTKISTPYFVDTAYLMKYYGSILDLDGFTGPIILDKNTFENNVVRYTNCDVTGDMISSTNNAADSYSIYGTKTVLQIRSIINYFLPEILIELSNG